MGSFDLPPGWRGAEPLRLTQGACAGPDDHAPARLHWASRADGTSFLAVYRARFRCDQRVAAFARREGEVVHVLLQPEPMMPAGVARCDCPYDLVATVPATMLRGVRAATVQQRGDRYGLAGAEPALQSLGLVDLRPEMKHAPAGNVLPPDPLAVGTAAASPGWVDLKDVPAHWTAMLRPWRPEGQGEPLPLSATPTGRSVLAPPGAYTLDVATGDGEQVASLALDVAPGRTLEVSWRAGHLALGRWGGPAWRKVATVGGTAAGAAAAGALATWLVMRRKGGV